MTLLLSLDISQFLLCSFYYFSLSTSVSHWLNWPVLIQIYFTDFSRYKHRGCVLLTFSVRSIFYCGQPSFHISMLTRLFPHYYSWSHNSVPEQWVSLSFRVNGALCICSMILYSADNMIAAAVCPHCVSLLLSVCCCSASSRTHYTLLRISVYTRPLWTLMLYVT